MLRLIKATDYGALLDLVSPRFFEVLPARALSQEVGALIKGYRNKNRFRAILEDRRDIASELLDVDLVQNVPTRVVKNSEVYGQRLLELFFWQLFACETMLLDLRSSRVGIHDGRLQWKPSRIYTTWDAAFLEPLRQLYSGFYDGNTREFDAALDALELFDAKPLFLEHFGAGDQRSVRFELDAFQSVFHRVFVSTRDAGKKLNPSFISLGVYLGGLYENLSRFDRGFDVREAYTRARQKAKPLRNTQTG